MCVPLTLLFFEKESRLNIESMDRRAFPRFEVKGTSVKVIEKHFFGLIDKELEDKYKLCNISKGGCCILTSKPIKVKTKLLLTIFFPTLTHFYPLEVCARVIWQKKINGNKYKTGCKFIKPNAHFLEKIHHLWLIWAKYI